MTRRPRTTSPLALAPTYGRIVRRVSSQAALWVAAAWGFAEASFFFIVPDVWLGFVALFAPRRMPATLAATVAGAAAGATVLYLLSRGFGAATESFILALPAIASSDLDAARAELADVGAAAILPAVLEARPVKLYIHAAAIDGIPLVEVVIYTTLNRVLRLAAFGALMMVLGWAGRPIVGHWPRLVAVIYATGWVAFYVIFELGPWG